MGSHDIQQVCLNGHQITDRYNEAPEFRKAFCPKCGEKTINACQHCHTPIQGAYIPDNAVLPDPIMPIPTHCDRCGEPFPWKDSDKDLVADNWLNNLKDTVTFEAFGIKFNGPTYMAIIVLLVLITYFLIQLRQPKENGNESWQSKPLTESLSVLYFNSDYYVNSNFCKCSGLFYDENIRRSS